MPYRSKPSVSELLISFSLLSFSILFLAARPTTADDRSWTSIDTLRSTLEARSPVVVEFEQSLVPAGFGPEDGEVESGRLAINLPACLRWDYLGDFEKSFLLCDSDGYYWNPGETVGQIFSLDGQEDAPGLDFFLQEAAVLKQRYNATSTEQSGRLTINLEPHTPTEDVVALRLVIERSSGLLQSMSYDDIDGNRTTFVLTHYTDSNDHSVFSPPDGVSWESQ